MRGDDGVMVKGRFTPIRSGHLPPQRQLHGVYRTPGQRRASSAGLAMLGAQDEPARVVQLGPRNGQAQIEEGVGNEERRVRGERAKKCLKCVFWVLFCCGLCEEWDLAAANDHGIQRVVVRGGKGGRRVGARWGYV